MENTVYVTVRVDYSCDNDRFNEEDIRDIAIDMAIRPLFDSVIDGVKIDSVDICDINEE